MNKRYRILTTLIVRHEAILDADGMDVEALKETARMEAQRNGEVEEVIQVAELVKDAGEN